MGFLNLKWAWYFHNVEGRVNKQKWLAIGDKVTASSSNRSIYLRV